MHLYELTYIRKDGSRFPAVVSVTALRDPQDAIIGYLLIGTELKAGALQSAIFNSANFSSIATDAEVRPRGWHAGIDLTNAPDGAVIIDARLSRRSALVRRELRRRGGSAKRRRVARRGS